MEKYLTSIFLILLAYIFLPFYIFFIFYFYIVKLKKKKNYF